MTHPTVEDRNRIVLNGKTYRTKGNVIQQLASEYPPRLVFGDSARAIRSRTDTLAMTDFRGGIGKEFIERDRDAERLWDSTFNHAYHGHLVFPPRVRQYTAPTDNGAHIESIVEFKGSIYGWQHRKVFRWNPTTAWSDALFTAEGDLKTMRVLSLGDEQYLFVAHGSGLAWTTNGTTWTTQASTRVATEDVTLPAIVTAPYGLAWTGSEFLVGDADANRYFGVNKDDTRNTADDSEVLADGIHGIDYESSSRRYVLTDDNYIRGLSSADDEVDSLAFDLDDIVGDAQGIVTASDGTILVVDKESLSVKAFQEQPAELTEVEALAWTGTSAERPYALRFGEVVNADRGQIRGTTLYHISSYGQTVNSGHPDEYTEYTVNYSEYNILDGSLIRSAQATQDNVNPIPFPGQVAIGTSYWYTYDRSNDRIIARSLSSMRAGNLVEVSSQSFPLSPPTTGAGPSPQKIIATGNTVYAVWNDGSSYYISSNADRDGTLLGTIGDTSTNQFIFSNRLFINWSGRNYRAWTLAGVHDDTKDFTLPSGFTQALGGTYVVAKGPGTNGSYKFYTFEAEIIRLEEGDWNLDPENTDPTGLTRRDSTIVCGDGIAMSLFMYTETGSPLASQRQAIPSVITDLLGITHDGSHWWLLAGTTIYRLGFDEDATIPRFVAMLTWNDKIWGITAEGQLESTSDLSVDPVVWADEGKIPTHQTPVNNLVLYASSFQQTDAIYAITTTGVFEYDATNQEFYLTVIEFAKDVNAGLGAAVWQGDLYISVGLSIYRVGGGATATVDLIGWDRDDGSPFEGTIVQLLSTDNYLLALVLTNVDGGDSYIMAYNRLAWWTLWKNEEGDSHTIWVGDHSGGYFLYLNNNDIIGRMNYPRGIVNPSVVRTNEYAPSAAAITPWFRANEPDIDKVALNLRAEIHSGDLDEIRYVEVDYQMRSDADDGTTWRPVTWRDKDGTEDTRLHDGFFESLFEQTVDAIERNGIPFRAVRFRIRGTRGSDATKFPDLQSLVLEYLKNQETKWAYTVTIDLDSEFDGRSPETMRQELVDLSGKSFLVSFNYLANPDAGSYVRLERPQSSLLSGRNIEGTEIVTLIEL